jgi:ribonuclease HI/exonuclease III
MRKNINHLQHHSDLVFVQETHFNLLEEDAFVDEKWVSYHSNGDGSKGVIILVRKELLLFYSIEKLKLHASMDGHALALHFSPINKHGDSPFTAVNCYLYTGTARGNHFSVKSEQLKHLNNLPTSRHFFMGGDFNFLEDRDDTTSDTEYHSHTPEFASLWAKFQDKYGLSQIRSDSHTYYKICASAAKSHSSRLDRIYTTYTEADIESLGLSLTLPNIPHNIMSDFNSPWLENMKREGSDEVVSGSDHIPILTQFNTGSKGDTRPSIPVWTTKTKTFSEKFDELWENKPNTRDVLMDLEIFNEMLFQASDYTRKYCGRASKEEMEGRVRLDVLIRLLRILTAFGSTATELKEIRTRYPYLEQHLLSEDWSVNAEKLQKHINELYANKFADKAEEYDLKDSSNRQDIVTKLSQLLPSRRQKLVRIRATIKSDYTSDPKRMAEIVREPLAKIWAKRKTKIKPKKWLEFYANQIPKELIPNLPNIDDAEDVIADSNDSCTGPDGIPFSAYRAVKRHAAPLLVALFKVLTKENTTVPKNFNHGLLFLIPKTDSGLPLDTRPISVTNSINRLVAKLAVQAITPAVQMLIDKAQKGFIPGRQGGDHIRTLNERFYQAVEDKDEHYILFMDTRKAFDSISHEYIHEVLKKFGLPTWFLTLVKNLLKNVLVNPVLGGSSDIWIAIKQGVKQGCPLSPIIFAIVVDPLLRALRNHTKCEAFAFADDLAIDTRKLHRLNLCMRIVDQFGDASGAQQNHHKTAIISATSDTQVANWIETSPWVKLKNPLTYTYLGVLFGRHVSTATIFKKAVNKLVGRANDYSPIAKRLSHAKRVTIYNVFIISILTYITNFFLFPYDLDASAKLSLLGKVRKAARDIIIPYGGTGYKYIHLVGGQERISSAPPIRDITALSIATLAAKSDFSEWDQHRREELPPMKSSSMKISEHIRAASRDTVYYHLSSDEWGVTSSFQTDSLIKDSAAENRKRIYKRLIYTIFTWETQNPDVEIIAARRELTIHQPEGITAIRLCPTTPTAELINRNYARLPCHWPKQIRHINFSFFFNALASTERRKDFDENTMKCPMCGYINDDASHILVSCVPVCRARDAYAHTLNIKINPTDLSTDSYPASSRDIAYLNFDGENKVKEVIAIAIFNYSTWYQYWDYFKTLGRSNATVSTVNRIASAATLSHLCNTSAKKSKGFGNASTRTKEQATAAKEHVEKLLGTVKPGDVVVYTDGSCLGNPGPTGAGVYIQYPTEWGVSDTTIAIPLGQGTNNIGELYAIGAAIKHIINTISNNDVNIQNIIFLSDSSYSLGCLTKGWQSKKNKTLIRSVKKLIRSIPGAKHNTCKWHWTPGHADVYGNNIADRIANEGSLISKTGGGPNPDTVINNIINCKFLHGAKCIDVHKPD